MQFQIRTISFKYKINFFQQKRFIFLLYGERVPVKIFHKIMFAVTHKLMFFAELKKQEIKSMQQPNLHSPFHLKLHWS